MTESKHTPEANRPDILRQIECLKQGPTARRTDLIDVLDEAAAQIEAMREVVEAFGEIQKLGGFDFPPGLAAKDADAFCDQYQRMRAAYAKLEGASK